MSHGLASDGPPAPTTPCPGCGLPRDEAQSGTACPVCAAAPADAGGGYPRPAEIEPPDPTAGLPADAAELARSAAADPGFPRWLPWAAVFLLGTVAGAAGAFGWLAASRPAEVADGAPVPPADPPAVHAPVAPPSPPPHRVEIETAPMPREIAPPPELEVAPAPRAAAVPPLPPRVFTIDLNDPDLAYTLSSDMRKARWVILRGRVKSLKLSGLDGGQVLDASGLEAASVSVSGRIDERAVLKVSAPGGTVSIRAEVAGRSTVEIAAPGGEVHFPQESRPGRPGSQIGGGSAVTITARRVDLRGDVGGAGTRVTVNLTGDGWLWAEAVRGGAVVEYRAANGRGKPSASAGDIDPAATFKRTD